MLSLVCVFLLLRPFLEYKLPKIGRSDGGEREGGGGGGEGTVALLSIPFCSVFLTLSHLINLMWLAWCMVLNFKDGRGRDGRGRELQTARCAHLLDDFAGDGLVLVLADFVALERGCQQGIDKLGYLLHWLRQHVPMVNPSQKQGKG
jgi:hypothetical protein